MSTAKELPEVTMCRLVWSYWEICCRLVELSDVTLPSSGSSSPVRHRHEFTHADAVNVGRDSSVSITTRYGLGGPGIESRW